MRGKLTNYAFNTMNYSLFTVFMFMCIYPFYYIFLQSISDPFEASRKQVILLPAGFTVQNYINIFKLTGMADSFFVSISRTVIGTAITLFLCSLFAFVLMKKELYLRKTIYRLTIVTMYMNAGLIPWYITMFKLGLKNNFLLYILPAAIQPFAMILFKTYMEQIPNSLEESAIVDGAGYFTVYTRIIMPTCKPIIAAIGVFTAVGQWNAWFDNFILVNSPKLQTLQLTLLNYLRQAEAIALATSLQTNAASNKTVIFTPLSVKMTITMVVAIPIIIVYPLLQKYFVKGIMVGAIKG